MTVKLFNHGVFQQLLQEKIESVVQLRGLEKDPYKQWNLDDQVAILTNLLEEYKGTVSSQLNN